MAERRVLVCLCTYNERENLPALLPAIWHDLPTADILVIDDNSPDGTGQWCSELAETEPRLRVVRRAAKLGLGTATAEGMRYAVQHGYDWLVTMDADFSHPPEVVPRLIAAATESVDVVVASRYAPEGGVVGWPWRRRWMSRLVNGLARRSLRLTVRDISGAFRCYRVSRLPALLAGPIHAKGYAFFEEVLWRLRRQGARIVEIPYVFRDRTRGRSKLNLREAGAALGLILWLAGAERGWLVERAEQRPVR